MKKEVEIKKSIIEVNQSIVDGHLAKLNKSVDELRVSFINSIVKTPMNGNMLNKKLEALQLAERVVADYHHFLGIAGQFDENYEMFPHVLEERKRQHELQQAEQNVTQDGNIAKVGPEGHGELPAE